MTRAILLAGILSLTDGAQAASTMVVKTTTAQSATLRKTTSQPATTRAFHEVALHAKLAGYAWNCSTSEARRRWTSPKLSSPRWTPS